MQNYYSYLLPLLIVIDRLFFFLQTQYVDIGMTPTMMTVINAMTHVMAT